MLSTATVNDWYLMRREVEADAKVVDFLFLLLFSFDFETDDGDVCEVEVVDVVVVSVAVCEVEVVDVVVAAAALDLEDGGATFAACAAVIC
jgi:hypothetical protein